MPILEDGQLFERYRVHRWLGSGIAGESYEAEDRILQRKVTLKLIHPWATLSDSARRQFFREMQGISLLNHPYLATVLDYGEVDGRIYVARRYVSSGSLLGANGRLWFHAPLPVAGAFTYAYQLAQALQYIHQHGYLHGSLTFANVLVLRGPNSENDTDYAPFLVADVGLANFVRRFGHPRLETLPVSAAPEQLGKRVTPASDQFALAVLLYFWLAGRPPYLGTSTEVEHQKLSETITPLSILNPGISLEQDEIILRALTVYPEERHASVLAFAETLLASLTSANRQYATPLSPFAPQPETPRDLLHLRPDETSASATPVDSAQAAAPTTPAEEVPTPVLPAQSQTEVYRSALEQLLAVPQSEPENLAPSEEASSLADEEVEEEQIEFVQEEEEPVLFPPLPETPRVEESILQEEFIHIIPESFAASEESASALALDELSPTTENLLSRTEDAFSPTGTETTAFSVSDEPLSTEEEATPVLLENETFVLSEKPDSSPTGDDEPSPKNAEVTLAGADSQDGTVRSPDAADLALPTGESSPAIPQVESFLANSEEEPALIEPAKEHEEASGARSTIPLEELHTVPEESFSLLAPVESELTNAESDPINSQDEVSLPNEEARTLAEPAGELPTDSIASQPTPAFEAESSLAFHLQPPIEETHEAPNEDYPLLDEVIVAPCLLISSPYTSSSFEFVLVDEEINIGRAGSSDLYLEQDNLTSRHHALLKRVGERVMIFDKRSHNGVFINGQKIEVGRGYELSDGDHIGIGNYELIFRSVSTGQVSQLI